MSTLILTLNDYAGRARRLDRVWLVVAVLLAGLALFLPAQAWDSLRFTLEALLAITPFLVVAVGVAGFVKATGADNLIAKAFQGRLSAMILLAALFGGLSPFCSCGVIPIIAALLSIGVPLPAVMAFWLASPIMDPTMFVVTAGALGAEFAAAKTVAAVAMGLFGGFGTAGLQRLGLFADPLREGIGDGGCGGSRVRSPGTIRWRFWEEPPRRRAFGAEAAQSGLFLLKWLSLAFLLESLMLTYLPADAITGWIGGDGLAAIPVAVLVGVPAYLNGYAALPLVAGLMDLGLTPGAAMAFLVAGGVTSLPAAIAVFALVKRPVFAAYIGFALAGAAVIGLAFQVYAGA